MISSGKYRAKATGMSFVNSPEKGTPGVEVTFRLQEGPDTGAAIGWVGWLTESTEKRTGESLKYCGYNGTDEASVMTNEVQLVIEQEEFTRKDGSKDIRPRVAWVNDASGAGQFKPMDPAAKANAQARLKAIMAATKAPLAQAAKVEDEVKF